MTHQMQAVLAVCLLLEPRKIFYIQYVETQLGHNLSIHIA